MKSLRVAFTLLFALASAAAFAESRAQKSFEQLKSLAGEWEGKGSNGQPVEVTYRVTANGSALMSEIKSEDDMISMMDDKGYQIVDQPITVKGEGLALNGLLDIPSTAVGVVVFARGYSPVALDGKTARGGGGPVG